VVRVKWITRGVPLCELNKPSVAESKFWGAAAVAERKFGWLNAFCIVVFSSTVTRSVALNLFTSDKSVSKYRGPFSELIGKLPNAPGAGGPSSPGLIWELINLPVAGSVRMSRIAGLM